MSRSSSVLNFIGVLHFEATGGVMPVEVASETSEAEDGREDEDEDEASVEEDGRSDEELAHWRVGERPFEPLLLAVSVSIFMSFTSSCSFFT